jgi:hypothetical protein
MGLQAAKLGWKSQRRHYLIAVRGTPADDDPQILMVDVVEQDSVDHGGLPNL